MSNMTLADWREKVSKQLQFIEFGASMAARHARMLPGKPDWETKAECELARARSVLEAALEDIKTAQEIYAQKELAA
jgi:hypothetical protein